MTDTERQLRVLYFTRFASAFGFVTLLPNFINQLVAGHADLIAEEVRAEEVGPVSNGYRKTCEVEDIEVETAIEELAAAEASDRDLRATVGDVSTR